MDLNPYLISILVVSLAACGGLLMGLVFGIRLGRRRLRRHLESRHRLAADNVRQAQLRRTSVLPIGSKAPAVASNQLNNLRRDRESSLSAMEGTLDRVQLQLEQGNVSAGVDELLTAERLLAVVECDEREMEVWCRLGQAGLVPDEFPLWPALAPSEVSAASVVPPPLPRPSVLTTSRPSVPPPLPRPRPSVPPPLPQMRSSVPPSPRDSITSAMLDVELLIERNRGKGIDFTAEDAMLEGIRDDAFIAEIAGEEEEKWRKRLEELQDLVVRKIVSEHP